VKVKTDTLTKRPQPGETCPQGEPYVLLKRIKRNDKVKELQNIGAVMQNNPCGTTDISEVTMDTGGTSAEGSDNGGWQGPVTGRGASRPNKPDFPRLKITNSFQPLLERATDNTEAVPSQETSRTTRPTQVENTTGPKPPPPIVIHAFVENFDDLKRLLQQQVGRNYTVKFTRRNTTIYLKNKQDWIRVKDVLKSNDTAYHTFTHKDEKTHAFVLRGLCQGPTEEDVRDALQDENEVTVHKVYRMKGARRPCYLVVTDKTVTRNKLEAEARILMNTRIEWARHINNKIITQCHRCQRWGHATSNCNAAPRCLKCAGDHYTYTHKDTVPEGEVKCANCGGAHVASHVSCPAYKSRVQNLIVNRPNNTNKTTATIFVPAPQPTTNPWGRAPPAEATTSPNSQNDEPASATSLFAELKKLNEQINIKEAIRAIKDLSKMLSSAKTKEEKFNVMLEFSAKINSYDL
jgi:hypothetical protein